MRSHRSVCYPLYEFPMSWSLIYWHQQLLFNAVWIAIDGCCWLPVSLLIRVQHSVGSNYIEAILGGLTTSSLHLLGWIFRLLIAWSEIWDFWLNHFNGNIWFPFSKYHWRSPEDIQRDQIAPLTTPTLMGMEVQVGWALHNGIGRWTDSTWSFRRRFFVGDINSRNPNQNDCGPGHRQQSIRKPTLNILWTDPHGNS